MLADRSRYGARNPNTTTRPNRRAPRHPDRPHTAAGPWTRVALARVPEAHVRDEDYIEVVTEVAEARIVESVTF